MGFTQKTFPVQAQDFWGDRKIVMGTYSNVGISGGGEIITGLSVVELFLFQATGSVVLPIKGIVFETFPIANEGGSVSLGPDFEESGIWLAIGR